MYVVTVDEEKCTGCGTCVPTCPAGVFELEENEESKSIPVNTAACLGCMSCVEICPSEAITVVEV